MSQHDELNDLIRDLPTIMAAVEISDKPPDASEYYAIRIDLIAPHLKRRCECIFEVEASEFRAQSQKDIPHVTNS